ncbi:MAG: M2 family metallopeptidase [Deltaproteobacteria bacterium]|nr:M2 family metallopeptidase [Deltaproteobacteria bacterium]
MRKNPVIALALLLVLPFAGLARASQPSPVAPLGPTPEEAKAFAAKVNAELKELWTRQQIAEWIKSTHITDDTERNAAWANEDVMAYTTRAILDSRRFDSLRDRLDPDTARTLYLLRVSQALPAPNDPKKRQELATTAARLEGLYGKGKWCGKDGKKCRDLQQLEEVLAKSRKWDELLDAWAGWQTISVPMRPMYERLVALSNEGAREVGFSDTGELWRAGYDMSPADFEKESDRLWQQVRPLYEQLHCYVRGRLQKVYGKDKVPDGKPIPAHLLGNMWAQEWENIWDLVEPYPGRASLDIDAALRKQKYDPKKMVRLGEAFFVSLGFDPLPATFWERSMLEKPQGREVVCHASAWDPSFSNDLRIKMCIRTTQEDLVTIHHELGHNYYYSQYYQLPALFQQGANDGFHEAIGDAIALSITPKYLQDVKLLGKVSADEQALINVQLKDALERVAFLPFGKLIDQWRWDVFRGKVAPVDYNAAWWKLRRDLQGVEAPVSRSEADFDPGAKYHIPSNVPYTRYFIARILQFQFHRALCKAAGHAGPLHSCSIYGNKDAGAKLKAMLALGASKPWSEALYQMTGERQMDATAILDYFAPLQKWLQEQNQSRQCGW